MPDVKLLRIYTDETAYFGDHKSLEVVASRTRGAGLARATVLAGLALMLPVGALVAVPVAAFPPVVIAGFLTFGLMALLYLVTEELLVEVHAKPDTPLISSMFFVGFLVLS